VGLVLTSIQAKQKRADPSNSAPAVEENELDQRAHDWLEYRAEVDRDAKDKTTGKVTDPAVEAQKALRTEMCQVFSEKAAGKRKADDQAVATESRAETDYMMVQWREGMRETTGMLGTVIGNTFKEALSGGEGGGGGEGEGVRRQEFENFAEEQRAMHREFREEQAAGQARNQEEIMTMLRKLLPKDSESLPPH
jgi:hypothetical protein